MKSALHAVTMIFCCLVAAHNVRAQEQERLLDATGLASTAFEMATIGGTLEPLGPGVPILNSDNAPPTLRKLALVIGDGTYQFLQPQLANPTNDATLIAHTLQQIGFTLIGGSVKNNLTIAQFKAAVQQFSVQAANADVVIFYYAGHGVQQNGINYLVPTDSNPINGAPDLPTQMIDASTILAAMDNANIRLKILILDACRDNPFRSLGIAPTKGLADMSTGFAAMTAPVGTVIWYATAPGQTASDGVGNDGPFALAISHNIATPGQDIYGVFNKTGTEVLSVTAKKQQPWLSATPLDGNFYFVPDTAGSRSIFVAAPSVPEPENRIRLFSRGLHTESKSYMWGQSYTEVNSELDSHFSILSYTALPQANEFSKAVVRYFWVPLSGLPNVLSTLVPGKLLDGHCIDPQSYIVFFFKNEKLFRISIRLYKGGACSSYGWLTGSLFSGQHRSASIHTPEGDTTVTAHDDSNYSYIDAAQEDPSIVYTD